LNCSHPSIGRRLSFTSLLASVICVFPSAAIGAAQSGKAQPAYSQAFDLLQNGRNADALKIIDAALSAGVHDPALYNLKGLAASELGLDQEAEESFRTVIHLSPKAAMGYNNLGVLLTKLGRNREAADTFRKAHARDPQNFTALLGLGTSLAALHQYAEAASYLQQAWKIHPGDFQTGYQWALALREAKHPAAAKQVLNQLSVPQESQLAEKYYSLAAVIAEDLKEFAAAAQFYRRAYQIDPNSFELYLGLVRATLSAGIFASGESLPSPPENLSAVQDQALALLFASNGANQEAVLRFEAALQLDPSNEAITLNLASAYREMGQSAAAIDLIERRLQRQPSAALYDTLAGLNEQSGQYLEAVQNFQHAVELEPANEQYYFDLGMEYLSHFTFGPAAEVYSIGTQKFPTSSRQFLGLAFSHYAVREYAAAADAFMEALELDPGSPAVFQAWKTVLSFLAPKDWEKLLPRLGHLAVGHSQSAELAFCYGAALFRYELAKGSQGALDKPQALLEKSVRLQPDFPEAHLELGSLYAARKQDQKAVDQYVKAIEQDPKSDVAHYRLGQVYRDMKQLELATQELARYQELTRLHEEELKRSRSAIKQFVLSQPAKSN
jgi:tetratricopeptide (TPR) repeat protein